MNLYTGTFAVLFGLYIFGFLLSMLISFTKCSKVSTASSAIEGLWWTIGPSLAYFIGNWFPWIADSHGEVLKSFLGFEDVHLYGLAWIMMLASWIMTTRMIHTTDIAVCIPSDDELKKFEDELAKQIKEKKEKDSKDSKPID